MHLDRTLERPCQRPTDPAADRVLHRRRHLHELRLVRRVLSLRRHQDGPRLRASYVRPDVAPHVRKGAPCEAGVLLRLDPPDEQRPGRRGPGRQGSRQGSQGGQGRGRLRSCVPLRYGNPIPDARRPRAARPARPELATARRTCHRDAGRLAGAAGFRVGADPAGRLSHLPPRFLSSVARLHRLRHPRRPAPSRPGRRPGGALSTREGRHRGLPDGTRDHPGGGRRAVPGRSGDAVSPAPTREAVLEALGRVQEPELHRDLVSLGMIKDLALERGRVAFTVELTTPACPLRDQIEREARAAVSSLEGVSEVSLKLTSNVPFDGRARGLIDRPIRNAVAVGSGKGGVGKTTVAVNLAAALARAGARVGLLDADIYGPNVPTMLGLETMPPPRDGKMIPAEAYGVKAVSMAFLMPPGQPLIWRGPMLHSAIRQFIADVAWGELDYLIVDLPPGTGDAPLSLAQSLPLTG